jgi:ubiquinone/menaquinone biosynthesis C-methylase UbiE
MIGLLKLTHDERLPVTDASPSRFAAARATAIMLALVLTLCLRGPRAESASSAQSPSPAASPGPAQSPYRVAAASADGIGKFYDGREIAQVMGFDGAPWLDRPSREQEERPDLLVQELRLEPGMTVADIGAGSGYLSRRMLPLVAPGKVLAVDVQPQMVALLEQLSKQPGMGNLEPVQGSASDVKLPADSVDLAVMVDVYHELEFPLEVMRSVVRALKPGGRMVFVEYRAEDPKVPIKELHKMSLAQVRLEMRPLPLVWERTSERLPLQHIIVFRKREP